MRKILFSACCKTFMHQKACEGLIRLLKDGHYQVDLIGNVSEDLWSTYNLVVAFNKRGYEKIETLHRCVPIVYSILADDYEEESLEDKTKYEHLLLIAPREDRNYGESVTPLCFPCELIAEPFLKYHQTKPTILVGVGNGRSILRTFIILNTLPQYRVDIIYSGEQGLYNIGYASHVTVREDFQVDTLICNANLVIGSRHVALQAALEKKPVLVVGDHGSAGPLTSRNVIEQFHNQFLGQLGGQQDEYFPLDQLQLDMKTALKTSSRELEKIANLLKQEMFESNRQVWSALSSYAVG